MQNYNPQSREFVFDAYRFDLVNLQAYFYYSIQDKNDEKNILLFEEVINFDDGNFDLREEMNYDILDNILFHLHIALGISYYKLYPTEKLIIKSWSIDEISIRFWKKFYKNWLWEFLFTNKISPKNLFNFEVKSNKILVKKDYDVSEKALVAIGWGKDSIVSLELVRKLKIDFDTFVFGKIDWVKQKCINQTWRNNMLISREISENLFTLNSSWEYFNGHVPITGIIAFIMQAAWYLYDYQYFVLSNEHSANFWNTNWEWIEINHQWSKSIEFEIEFSQYIQKNISSHSHYFSLLRPLYEIKIAELFAKVWWKYFDSFSSCNNNFKIWETSNHKWIWCNKCPKCAFVYSMLHPFLEQETLIKIFWEDLYSDKSLKELFEELMWISWMKPFECVGTNEEVIYAMYLSYKKLADNEKPFILKIFEESVLPNLHEQEVERLRKKLFSHYNTVNIPQRFKKIYWE
jgi:UDP-N-acetyl-alpha-D-muramoyl-L-alanyl-L-glutamate epimerase